MSSDISDIFGGESFDTSQHEAPSDYGPLPPGDYVVTIEKAEVRVTKKGDGHYVWLQLSVLGEQFTNRKLFCNMNIDNPSEKAASIGRGQLAGLGKAINNGQDCAITSTDQLVGQVVAAAVKVKDNENEVRAFKPTGQVVQGPPPAAKPAPPKVSSPKAAATAGGQAPPWARK
jgi:hypothetical protein